VKWESFEAPSPLTPFERKYRDSGQTLYRCVVDLDKPPWRKTRHDPSSIHPAFRRRTGAARRLAGFRRCAGRLHEHGNARRLPRRDRRLAAADSGRSKAGCRRYGPRTRAKWARLRATLQKAIELVLRYYNDMLATIGDEEGDEEGEAEGWHRSAMRRAARTIRPSARNGPTASSRASKCGPPNGPMR
jgi:hypothetical protein